MLISIESCLKVNLFYPKIYLSGYSTENSNSVNDDWSSKVMRLHNGCLKIGGWLSEIGL